MKHTIHKECLSALMPVKDALEVISGKWTILILISIWEGNNRFKAIERSIPKLSSKVLAKELKDMEENHLIKRTIYDDYPVRIEYTATEYSKSLQDLIKELHKWGTLHREKIFNSENT